MNRKRFKLLPLVAILVIASLVLAACPAPSPEVQTVKETVVVEVEKVVEKQVEVVQTQIVEKEVVKEVAPEEYTTPHPILSDLRVRQALAYCIDRGALIASLYPYVEDQAALQMDSFLPKTMWAYSGPYPDLPQYDPEKGKALLDEAGWTQPEGAAYRQNAAGDTLALKFTTTTAQFRQTWAAVVEQNLADCGIQLVRQHTPASWWFGDTTGLNRRDFELGAFAWTGQPEPLGRTTHACDQIPLPSNNWEGQNYMGWCNQAASDAVVKGNNTLIRDERIAAYDIVQKEFAKDVVSIPMFQRAEAEAWTSNLQGNKPDYTEYATANLQEWTLADGGDTIVIGMTQEPDSLWGLVSSMAASVLVTIPAVGAVDSQYNYDYQPVLQEQLPTIESGLATNEAVDVQAGDLVYGATGEPVTLEAGVSVVDSEGNTFEYDGSSPLKMNQLTVTYRLKPFTWSDGTPGSSEDMKLGIKINCDPNSGATSFIWCDRVGDLEQDITYSADAPEMTIKYLPGSQDPTYFVYPTDIHSPALYPSHLVLSDGRNLADVPAAEWLTLPEIAETPLSFGPYYVVEWIKGQSLTLAQNPYYDGEVATPNVVFTFIADSNQAVAQLLSGDVDFLDKSTLGAGAEVQTVIDAAKSTGNVQYEILASPTWEHIDINLFTK